MILKGIDLKLLCLKLGYEYQEKTQDEAFTIGHIYVLCKSIIVSPLNAYLAFIPCRLRRKELLRQEFTCMLESRFTRISTAQHLRQLYHTFLLIKHDNIRARFIRMILLVYFEVCTALGCDLWQM